MTDREEFLEDCWRDYEAVVRGSMSCNCIPQYKAIGRLVGMVRELEAEVARLRQELVAAARTNITLCSQIDELEAREDEQ